MRVAIYLRISLDRKVEAEDEHGDIVRRDSKLGIARQLEDCEQLCRDLGWEIVETYPDNDLSATTGVKRPHYDQMLTDIADGKIDAVVAWHPDRLYRRPLDLEELIDICERYRVVIRTCNAGEMDLSTPTGRMVARLLGAVARHEVEHKAERWLRSVRQGREAGRWWNPANRPFGYNRDGTLNPREAKALRRVARDLLAGGTVNGACRWLNEHGLATTRGNEWMPSSLRATLRSPRLAGLSVHGGEIIGPGAWTPVLDRATWEKVRAVVDTKNPRAPRPRRALLSGLVFCGVEGCGRRLNRAQAGGRRKGRRDEGAYPIYRCGSELKANGHVAITAEPLERLVEATARRLLADPRTRRAAAARQSSADAAASKLAAEIDDLDQQIRDLETALTEAGTRSRLAVARSIDELDAQLEAKRASLGRLSQVALPVRDEWPVDLDARAALIGVVIARVWVDPAKPGRFDPARVRIEPVEL